jgi:hypothetical protein
MLGSVWLIVALSMFSVGFSMIIDRGKMRSLMWCGMIATWLAFIGWLTMIWSGSGDYPPGLVWWCVLFNGMAATMLVIGILAQLRLRSRWGHAARMTTMALSFLLGVSGSVTICLVVQSEVSGHWEYPMDKSEIAARASGVLAILTGCGLAATLLGFILPRLHEVEMPVAQRLHFTAVCPRCAVKQEFVTDGDACRECGLQIKVMPT